jgi:ligand-binding sensor domain-containing protein
MRLLSLLLCWMMGVYAAAQSPWLLEPTSFSAEQGLPSNYVYGSQPFAKDSLGFMWVGTGRGLVRFDGQQFQVLESLLGLEDSPLTEASITALLCDHRGDLWIGTWERGLFRLQQSSGQLQVYRFDSNNPGSIQDNRINYLYLDLEQRLWIGTDSRGICLFDSESEQFVHVEPAMYSPRQDTRNHFSNVVLRIEEHPATPGVLWIGTLRGLFAYEVSGKHLHAYFLDDQESGLEAPEGIRDFHIGADGTIWAGTWGSGLWSFHPERPRFRRHYFPDRSFQQNNIKAIEGISDTLLLLAAPQFGLGLYHTKSEKLTWLHEQAFEQDHLATPGAFYRDEENNLWIGTYEEGIHILTPARHQFPHFELPVEDLVKVIPSPDGRSLFGITEYSFQLLHLDLNCGELAVYARPNDSISPRKFNDIQFDKSGQLWLLTNYELLKWDGRTRQFIEFPVPYFDQTDRARTSFMSFAIDTEGHAWIGTNWSGLFRVHLRTGEVTHFDQSKDEKSRPVHGFWIHHLAVDPIGRIWYATVQGFGYYNPEIGQFVNYPYRSDNSDVPGVEFKRISHLFSEGLDRAWIGSSEKGLGVIRPGQPASQPIRAFSREHGLASDRIRHIRVDAAGRVWISHSKGLSCYFPDENRFINLGPEYGLPAGLRMSLLPDGTLAACHSRGVYLIDPEKVLPAPTPPLAHITRFQVFGREVGFLNPLASLPKQTLPHNENFISFEFQAVSYGLEAPLEYACMLQGVDEQWVYTGNRAYAAYTNLKGGRYRFLVRARVAEGAWGEPASMEVHIVPAIWQTRWFWATIALTCILALLLTYQSRIQRIQAEELLKRNFAMQVAEAEMTALRAQMNPHFLFNSLNSIRVFIIENDARSASHYLNRFARLIRLTLENSRHSTVSLADELEAIRLYVELEMLRLEHTFEFKIELPDTVSLGMYEVPPLILQPFVENAIWHGLTHRPTGGVLQIRAALQDQNLVCIVEDNGIGREAAQRLRSNSSRESLGLSITQTRLELLSETYQTPASFELEDLYTESGDAAGTRATIFLPLLKGR